MQAKTFEIRDEATHIPALGIKLNPGNGADRAILARAGYGLSPKEQAGYVFLCKLAGGEEGGTYDPYHWRGGCRTMTVAHDHIIRHFDELESGAVVDVQFILGETKQPKLTENAA